MNASRPPPMTGKMNLCFRLFFECDILARKYLQLDIRLSSMSTERDTGSRPAETWSVLASHDWAGKTPIETSLLDALDRLSEPETGVLYDYVDTEAVVDVLAPSANHGATEVRFEYGQHEIRITQDGTIAAR